jgi:fatty acid desaturase
LGKTIFYSSYYEYDQRALNSEVLENPAFRYVPSGRLGFFCQFSNIFSTWKCRLGRILFSAAGIPVDYNGTGWSLNGFSYGKDSGIMQRLQRTAIAQLTIYTVIFLMAFQIPNGLFYLVYWWIVPVLCGYPFINFFRNLEYANCEVSKAPNCLRNTRIVRSNILIRTLLWDTNFHAEHHCYPLVPFCVLHKLNELMNEHIVNNECDHFITRIGWL